MRTMAMLATLAACVVLAGSILMGQDTAPPVGKQVKAGDQPAGDVVKKEGEKARIGDIGNKMDKAIGGFTDDQKQQIVAMNKTREAALKEINDKFIADAEALMTDDQKAKWQESLKAAKNYKKGEAVPNTGGDANPGAVKGGTPKEGEATK